MTRTPEEMAQEIHRIYGPTFLGYGCAAALLREWAGEIRREALEEAVRASKTATAPVQPEQGFPFPTRIPWAVHERAWSQYAAAGHGDQSARRLAERGGFGVRELCACLLGRGYSSASIRAITPDDVAKVREEIEARIRALETTT